MHFNDTESLQPSGKVRYTSDGYLVTDAKVARTGVQEYLGSELGRPEMAIIRVYRPPEVVFSDAALRSYAHRPIVLGHPDHINSKNWKQHTVGGIGGEVMRDGEFVRVPMLIMDEDAIAKHKAGLRELSMSYNGDLEFRDGVTPQGEPYDAVMTSMTMNHLGMVPKARGGEELRIGDERTPDVPGSAHQPTGGHQMAGTLKTVIHDGLSIETTEQGAQVIDKLQRQLADAKATMTMADTAHAAALADKAKEIDKLTAERDAAKAAQLSDAQLDARVAARADLLSNARKVLADGKFDGKSDEQIRLAVVTAKLGDAAVAGKSADYVAARFDLLVEGAGATDPIRLAIQGRDAAPTPSDNGQSEYEARLLAGRNAK